MPGAATLPHYRNVSVLKATETAGISRRSDSCRSSAQDSYIVSSYFDFINHKPSFTTAIVIPVFYILGHKYERYIFLRKRKLFMFGLYFKVLKNCKLLLVV